MCVWYSTYTQSIIDTTHLPTDGRRRRRRKVVARRRRRRLQDADTESAGGGCCCWSASGRAVARMSYTLHQLFARLNSPPSALSAYLPAGRPAGRPVDLLHVYDVTTQNTCASVAGRRTPAGASIRPQSTQTCSSFRSLHASEVFRLVQVASSRQTSPRSTHL